MENKIDILNELQGLSPLIAGMDKLNVFTVPEGYFTGLSSDILASLKEEKSSLISNASGHSTFSVPTGYFDTLSDAILFRIKASDNELAADELRTLSPMLYSIQNENVFEVPQGYFESLSENIVELVKPQSAKLITMRRRTSTFVKYAVAAAFTGVMALGVFKFTGSSKDSIDPAIALGTQIATDNKFEEELSKVSDADIVKYLEANGSDVNAALVANSVDQNELPSQEDYLTDDKTLDKYLNSINVNELKN